MRIAFVVGEFPSISQSFVLNQVTGLIDRGHEVDIVAKAPDEDGAKAHADVARYRLLERTWYRPPRAARRGVLAAVAGALGLRGGAAALRPAAGQGAPAGGRYDAIHAHFGPNGLDALALRAEGVLAGPLSVVFHGNDMSRYVQKHGPRVYDPLFREAALLLPISDRWRRKLIEWGADPARTIVHPMGVDTARFAFRERRPDPDGGPVRVLSICRLVAKKGIDVGVRAVAEFARAWAGGPFPLRYEVAGDGEERAALEALARDLGVAEHVRFLGWCEQAEVIAAVERAHALLAPSVTSEKGDEEGIPVALMEAMACGLPVVSTLHSGIPELVEDGVSGYLVPERDAAALAGALRRLVEDPARWPAMGRAGRARVEERFDIGKLNDRLIAHFESMGR